MNRVADAVIRDQHVRLSRFPAGALTAACCSVCSGTGIALIPESTLETVKHARVARQALPQVHANLTTPSIWRASEQSAAVGTLKDGAGADAPRCSARANCLTGGAWPSIIALVEPEGPAWLC